MEREEIRERDGGERWENMITDSLSTLQLLPMPSLMRLGEHVHTIFKGLLQFHLVLHPLCEGDDPHALTSVRVRNKGAKKTNK